MSDPSPTIPLDEKTKIEPQLSYQNVHNVATIEQKLHEASSDGYPSRTLIIKRKAKRKDDGPLEIVCGFIVEHQIGMQTAISLRRCQLTRCTGLAVNLLMLLALTHMSFPRARRHTRKFFELSYFNPETGEYRAGWNDAWMVSFWIVVFTGLRASVMDYVLIPFAKRYNVKTERNQTRFGEQAWLLLYYVVFWTLGMVRPNLDLDVWLLRVSVYLCEFRLLAQSQGNVDQLA